MKAILRIFSFLLIIILLVSFGLRDASPVKADAPNQMISIVIHAPSSAANGESFTVYATADSGLDVSYSAAGGCTNLGATFTMISDSSTCTVQYDQTGDSNYDPAPQVTENVSTIPTNNPMPKTVSPAQSVHPNSVGPGLYVSPTGSDSNTCLTPADPCLTINGAAQKSNTGDSIYVAAGTYTGTNVESVVADLWSCVHLSGGWDATFTTQNALSIIDGENQRGTVGGGCSIDHFIIENSNTSGIDGYGDLTVSNSIIRNNHAGSGGSAIFATGDLTINNSTLENNASETNAGAIEMYLLNSLTLNNTIITENQGGGIYLNGVSGGGSAPNITIINSTITNNTSSNEGAGINDAGSYPERIITLKNSILSGNSAPSAPDCSGTITVADHNIIEHASGCTLNSSTGNIFNVDPLLADFPFGQLDSRILLDGSPAIDAGNPATCLATDQRGATRKDGDGNGSVVCDIGAYEYNPTPGAAAILGVSSGSNQRTIPGTSFAAPLVAYVTDAEGNPVSGVTVTFTAPASGPSGTFENSTNTTSAISNSNGLATSSIFSANEQAGSYAISAAAPSLASVEFAMANAVWYVSPLGSDSNTCATPEMPCLTINEAINKAASGDSIKVATGTYTGTGSAVVTIAKKINLQGGWDASFTTSTGLSIIDGESARDGIDITGIANLSQMVIQHNEAGIANSGVVTINRSAIIHNQNGISNSGNITVINSTISGNTAYSLAGSAVSNVGGTVDIRFSTITNNASAYGGEAIYSLNGGAIIKIANSILANNPGGDCNVFNYNMISGGHNLFGSNPPCYDYGTESFVPDPSDLIGVDPQLTPLVAPGFHVLAATSQAINYAGATCPSVGTDQRGVTRPQDGGCDIGAYEFQAGGTAVLMGTNKGSDQRSGTDMPYTIPLSVYVVDETGNPVENVSVTFTAPTTDATGIFADSQTNTTVAVTNHSGIATASIFTANNIYGSFNVTATSSGLPDATFTLTNVPIPTTLLPNGKTNAGKPVYRWSAISVATQYQYEVWKGASLVYQKTVATTACTVTTCASASTLLLKPGDYKWRVQTMVNGEWQGFGPYKTFKVILKAGLWTGKGLSLYVAPTLTSIKKYAVNIYVNGCGAYKITYTKPIRINSKYQFTFPGAFYANGIFTSPTAISGKLGFKHFLLPGCGYISGGPFVWTAAWKNSSQPAVIQDGLIITTLIEPLTSIQDAGSFTVERVGP